MYTLRVFDETYITLHWTVKFNSLSSSAWSKPVPNCTLHCKFQYISVQGTVKSDTLLCSALLSPVHYCTVYCKVKKTILQSFVRPSTLFSINRWNSLHYFTVKSRILLYSVKSSSVPAPRGPGSLFVAVAHNWIYLYGKH